MAVAHKLEGSNFLLYPRKDRASNDFKISRRKNNSKLKLAKGNGQQTTWKYEKEIKRWSAGIPEEIKEDELNLSPDLRSETFKKHLNKILYKEYDKKVEAYNEIVSDYLPVEILNEVIKYKDEYDYSDRLSAVSDIFSQMEGKEKECLNDLEEFFEEEIKDEKENYLIIKNLVNTICGFDFNNNPNKDFLNHKRINFLKSIYENYSPQSNSHLSKEQIKEGFKKDITNCLKDLKTPLIKNF